MAVIYIKTRLVIVRILIVLHIAAGHQKIRIPVLVCIKENTSHVLFHFDTVDKILCNKGPILLLRKDFSREIISTSNKKICCAVMIYISGANKRPQLRI